MFAILSNLIEFRPSIRLVCLLDFLLCFLIIQGFSSLHLEVSSKF